MRYIVPKPKRLMCISSLTQHIENKELSSQWWLQHNHAHTSMNRSSIKSSDPIPIVKNDKTMSNNSSFINSSI